MKYVLDNENDEEEPEQEDSDFEPEDEEDPISSAFSCLVATDA